ncbi:MAG: ATP-dependent DNA helicase RecG [Saprospiraceae bacterium]|jgi:ATP-dependent DNA helicase RecG|nr:ATP-dependent DNA helicase RecG [Saprospiraceae bacterium]
MNGRSDILETPIEYVKGIGPSRGDMLRKELGIHTIQDLLFAFPFRYIDRTTFYLIKDLTGEGDSIQLKGTLISLEKIKGKNQRTRLTGMLKDSTGFLELVWFQGASWLEKTLVVGEEYIVFGKMSVFGGKKTMAHPEMELMSEAGTAMSKTFDPVYSSTEKLDAKGIDSKSRRKILRPLLLSLQEYDLAETLPPYLVKQLHFCTRLEAMRWIHFPENEKQREQAGNRIKFEEFFYVQLRLLQSKQYRQFKYKSVPFLKVGDIFHTFYQHKLPFALTDAQKKVIKEIRGDLAQPRQMNRLLQGDVGSGKTIVALLTMLLAIDNGFQCCLMAPTEILAQQHYASIKELLGDLLVEVAFLSGSVKGKKRQIVLDGLGDGKINIVIGTHALLEDPVNFAHLGLAIVDEQHRFGVAQRARLWKKNDQFVPHVLVMTATPIPRTLAMTLYGDLDVSVIDSLPPGRKEIKTIHKYESARPQLIQFMHAEIAKGRQIYIVYPLIEESEKLDLQNLNDGYERLLQYFPQPNFQISVVHGRMKAAEKDWEMQRFIERKTQIMVATTVIEVGVNVPNASVMIIENTERFGLSQLHQLRGRVGRGAEQSYCILMSDTKLSKESRERIATMVRTNNGFDIAEADLRLRGPGDIQGTQQSGVIDFKLLQINKDQGIMQIARQIALDIMSKDPLLDLSEHVNIRQTVIKLRQKFKDWGRIS